MEAAIFDDLTTLADATRSRMLLVLERNELTVSELCAVLQLPQSTVSRHLKTLSDAGWVASRREGTSRFYSLALDERAPAAQSLWALLREQVAGTLDGPLHGMPFATIPLPRGTSRELLIDRFVIAGAPSLAVALRPAPRHRDDGTLVAVISDPVYTSDDRRLTVATGDAALFRGDDGESHRLARLPYSAIEARSVMRVFDGARIIALNGFDATARRVVALPSKDLDVLHFATHAVIREDAPEQSALFLSEYAADGSPVAADRLTADDITRSGLRADIVVLSGCATGDGRELRGEGVLGLTYGFLANGSNTVVASLWPVEDALTARFMREFYFAYGSSGRVADALRTAQLRTRDTAGPSVWSSFVVRSSSLQ